MEVLQRTPSRCQFSTHWADIPCKMFFVLKRGFLSWCLRIPPLAPSPSTVLDGPDVFCAVWCLTVQYLSSYPVLSANVSGAAILM